MEIFQNSCPSPSGTQMHICGFRPHSTQQYFRIMLPWKVADFDGIRVGLKPSDQPFSHGPLVRVVLSNRISNRFLIIGRAMTRFAAQPYAGRRNHCLSLASYETTFTASDGNKPLLSQASHSSFPTNQLVTHSIVGE